MRKVHSPLDAKLAKVQSLAASGQINDAIQLLESLCRKYKKNADPWFMRGVIYGKSGNYEKAVDCLKRAISLRPDHALSYFNLGNALGGQGKFTEAVMAYEKAIKYEHYNVSL